MLFKPNASDYKNCFPLGRKVGKWSRYFDKLLKPTWNVTWCWKRDNNLNINIINVNHHHRLDGDNGNGNSTSINIDFTAINSTTKDGNRNHNKWGSEAFGKSPTSFSSFFLFNNYNLQIGKATIHHHHIILKRHGIGSNDVTSFEPYVYIFLHFLLVSTIIFDLKTHLHLELQLCFSLSLFDYVNVIYI